MDLHKLKCFVAVVEEGSLSAAARAINMTQPPLTLLIQKLEREAGVALFVRRNRSLIITDEGRLLYKRAKELLAHSASIATEIRDHSSGTRGTVVIGCTSAVSLFILPQVLQQIRDEGLKIIIHSREGETAYVLNEMRERLVDIAVVRTAYQAEDLVTRTLLHEPLMLATPTHHRLANKRVAHISDLRDEPFFLHTATTGAGVANTVIQRCEAAGFTPQVVYRGSETLPMLRMVAYGLGIMLVPASYATLALAERPAFIPMAEPEMVAHLSVVTYKHSVLSGAATRVLGMIEKNMGEMAATLAPKNWNAPTPAAGTRPA